MDENADHQPAAASHASARLQAWVRRWVRLTSGTARDGGRTGPTAPAAPRNRRPVPAWLSPEAVRAGFAEGAPLRSHERDAARRAGVPPTRLDLFSYFLGEDGLRPLWSLLDSGRYEVTLPEEAALLTVAWLIRAGDEDAAEELVAQLRPFADRLPLTPRPADHPAPPADSVRRRTAAEASIVLGLRKPHPAVEAQREALAVWRPFEDELLAHRLRADAEGHGAQWRADGAALLERYEDLAARHTRCTGHLNPKSNPAILRRALEEAVAGRAADPRLAGLLRHAVTSMVAKRGLPGSPEHTALRRAQAEQAARPPHHELAALARHRLAAPDAGRAAPGAGRLDGPVTAGEAARTGLPAGTVLPPAVRAPLAGIRPTALTALTAEGAVPSAEVLAELIPQLTTAHSARGYADEPLRTLLAATYRAGAARSYGNHWWTSDRHARTGTAPWVHAVADHGRDPVAQARMTLRAVGELAVEAFPGTGIPVRLVGTLSDLSRLAELEVSFVTAPCASAFGPSVHAEVFPALGIAADVLQGTLYERYHGLDFAALRSLAAKRDPAAFARLCAERAGLPEHRCTGEDGPQIVALAREAAVQEQAHVLTTFNMATLVREVGIEPASGWDGLARGAFTAARRRSATPKRTARAWRQLVFHLSLCDADEQTAVLTWIDAELARLPQASARLAPAVARLRLAATSSGTRPSPPACRP